MWGGGGCDRGDACVCKMEVIACCKSTVIHESRMCTWSTPGLAHTNTTHTLKHNPYVCCQVVGHHIPLPTAPSWQA